jgi:hypothetical protein
MQVFPYSYIFTKSFFSSRPQAILLLFWFTRLIVLKRLFGIREIINIKSGPHQMLRQCTLQFSSPCSQNTPLDCMLSRPVRTFTHVLLSWYVFAFSLCLASKWSFPINFPTICVVSVGRLDLNQPNSFSLSYASCLYFTLLDARS